MKAILAALTVLTFLFAGCEKAAHDHDAGHNHDHDAGQGGDHDHDHEHGEDGHDHDKDHAAPADDKAAAAVAKTYAVECGCAIDGIKKCGNYAVVDGKYMQMTGLDIGPMPFCQKTGLKADIVGEVVEGKLVVSKMDLVK